MIAAPVYFLLALLVHRGEIGDVPRQAAPSAFGAVRADARLGLPMAAVRGLAAVGWAVARATGVPRQTLRSSPGESGSDVGSDTTDPVRQGLREGGFPWYDSVADRLRPVWTPRMSWTKWLRQRWDRFWDAVARFFKSLGLEKMPSVGIRGDWLGMMLLATILATLFVFLLVLWLRSEPFAAGKSTEQSRPGSAQLLAQLAGASSAGLDDPWSEAERRRARGDLAGAIIYLFAHQLISLDRAGLIRLAPGWTGRQYVRWLRDPILADSLRATLALFEEIYYGHRLPSQVAFEQVWSRAQALEDRRRAPEVSR